MDRALIFLFSLKVLLAVRFGRQHWNDFKDFARWALTFGLGICSLLCKLVVEFLSLKLTGAFCSSSSFCLTLILCLKRSDNLIFLSVGDGCPGITTGTSSTGSSTTALWTRWDPVAKLWCNGVLPREGVNSAFNLTDCYKTMFSKLVIIWIRKVKVQSVQTQNLPPLTLMKSSSQSESNQACESKNVSSLLPAWPYIRFGTRMINCTIKSTQVQDNGSDCIVKATSSQLNLRSHYKTSLWNGH